MPLFESVLQWKIPQLQCVLLKLLTLSQAGELHSFVFCNAFQYILWIIMYFGWGGIINTIIISWVRRWECVHAFTTELGKKNFDLNLRFNIINLLTVFTRLKVHLDNVNYSPWQMFEVNSNDKEQYCCFLKKIFLYSTLLNFFLKRKSLFYMLFFCVLSMVLFEQSELTCMSMTKGAWNVSPGLLWNTCPSHITHRTFPSYSEGREYE